MGPDLLLYLIAHLLGAGVCVSRKGQVSLGLAKLCMGSSGMNSLHCKENIKFSYNLFCLLCADSCCHVSYPRPISYPAASDSDRLKM